MIVNLIQKAKPCHPPTGGVGLYFGGRLSYRATACFKVWSAEFRDDSALAS